MLRSAASPGSVGFGRFGSGTSGLLMTPLPAGHLSGRARDCKTHENCELMLLAQDASMRSCDTRQIQQAVNTIGTSVSNTKGARQAPLRHRPFVPSIVT